MIYNLDQYQGIKVSEFFEIFGLSKPKRHYILMNGLINDRHFSLDYLIKANDILEVNYVEEDKILPSNKKIEIIYEDDYFLIINKEANLKCHPNSFDETDTLLNRVKGYYVNQKYPYKVKYIHRLDIETSGLFIVVKDILTESYMNKYYNEDFTRSYLALAEGRFKEKSGDIVKGIATDRHKNRMFPSDKGQYASTHYEVLREYSNYSLLYLILKTGRTHQIRVHLNYIKHSILGDKLYDNRSSLINRVALHSYVFKFIHPYTKKELVTKANLPLDMKKLVGDFDEK